jgi:hypothetical protein
LVYRKGEEAHLEEHPSAADLSSRFDPGPLKHPKKATKIRRKSRINAGSRTLIGDSCTAWLLFNRIFLRGNIVQVESPLIQERITERRFCSSAFIL